MSDKDNLSKDDVSRLLNDTSADGRVAAAQKVASTFKSTSLSDEERKIAEDIFRVMMQDAAVRVRKALSESLQDNPNIPHDVAKTLAKDIEDVALPMVKSSSVLTDDDLIELIESSGEILQTAVAQRPSVSADIADALVDAGNEKVVAALVANDGADIQEDTFQKVLQKHGESDAVKAPMATRRNLPLSISEKLVTMVSDNLRQHILKNSDVGNALASDLLISSREKATVSLLEGGKDTQSVIDLVDQLYRNDRLTASLVVRALVMGDVTFFEAALARFADIPVYNAYKLVHDKGDLGLRRLFEIAKFPDALLPAARAALEVVEETLATTGDDKELFRQVMIERVLTSIEDEVDTENLDYLIGRLGQK